MPQLLPDDELLNVPLGNLLPGELARSFKVHSDHAHKTEEAEAQHLVQEQRVTEEHEQAEEDLQRREETVLAQLAEREELLRIEAQELDDRAIKLVDGRRAYVDGDRYRDAEGHELTGADRAQAEVLHVDHPNATTWQEQQKLETKWVQTEHLRQSIEEAQAGKPGSDENAAVSSAEKMLRKDTKIDSLPSYGAIDLTNGPPLLRL